MATQKGQILTVNPMGVFIEAVATKTYNGLPLRGLDNYKSGLVDGILEIQVMQSDTAGKYGMPGSPIPSANGFYTWLRIKTDDGIWSDWLYRAGADGLDDGILLASVTALTDTFVFASKKRRDFRAMAFANLATKKREMLGQVASSKNKGK